jgi:hypothetical protein
MVFGAKVKLHSQTPPSKKTTLSPQMPMGYLKQMGVHNLPKTAFLIHSSCPAPFHPFQEVNIYLHALPIIYHVVNYVFNHYMTLYYYM